MQSLATAELSPSTNSLIHVRTLSGPNCAGGAILPPLSSWDQLLPHRRRTGQLESSLLVSARPPIPTTDVKAKPSCGLSPLQHHSLATQNRTVTAHTESHCNSLQGQGTYCLHHSRREVEARTFEEHHSLSPNPFPRNTHCSPKSRHHALQPLINVCLPTQGSRE